MHVSQFVQGDEGQSSGSRSGEVSGDCGCKDAERYVHKTLATVIGVKSICVYEKIDSCVREKQK